MKEKRHDVTPTNDDQSGNTQRPMSSHEPDFIPLLFSVNDDDHIVLWKEHARHLRQRNRNEEHTKQSEQLLKESISRYGKPLGGLRLYDDGLVTLGIKTNELTPELSARGVKAGEDAWDEFYPEAAEAISDIKRVLLADIAEQKAVGQYVAQLSDDELHVKMLSMGGETLSASDNTPAEETMLKKMLHISADHLTDGGGVELFGIMTGRCMAAVHFPLPYEKHRLARCISDVAREVNAEHALMTCGANILDDECNPVGELLLGIIWNSDGTARGCSTLYNREDGHFVMDGLEIAEMNGGEFSIHWKRESADTLPHRINEAMQGGELAA